MAFTWTSDEPPEQHDIGAAGWVRAAIRGGGLSALILGGLLVLLPIRLVERPLFGPRRPATPFIVQFVCRNALRVLGVGFSTSGRLMRERGAVVANHSSWLDIFALNARQRVFFVSKAEVAGWPGIGWLVRVAGTVFIERDRARVHEQTALFEERLKLGQKLLFFPEGTSTDGLRVLPFKPSLFQAFYSEHLRDFMHVQPVSVVYHAPPGADRRFYGWWGDMDFGPHLLKVLAARRQGAIELVYHPPLRVSEFAGRKQLAAACERAVRSGHDRALGAAS